MVSYFTRLFSKKDAPMPSGQIKNSDLKSLPLPEHVAIIMDGNGRWAKTKGLPRAAGHRAGLESLKRTVEIFIELGIPYLTVYAFSTENWNRPKDEVDALMNLLVEYVERELLALHRNGVCVRAIGELVALPPVAHQQILKAMEQTCHNKKLNLQIAINYGGRKEIVEAIKKIAIDYKAGKINVEDIQETIISQYLYTRQIPDPDLVIRPSGENRISNFLLWQSAYSEFLSLNVLWPDFTEQHLYQAIHDYQQRHRRFGGL